MLENGMVIEPIEKKQKVYCNCDSCGEPIYIRQPITVLALNSETYITHQSCFCDFIEDNKIDCYAGDDE